MADSTGANDISIQTVSPASLQVNVNGEIKEIKNNLGELKSLLQKMM